MTTAPFALPPGFPPTDTLFYPSSATHGEAAVVLFLPGNPGLIGYYAPFLSHLAALNPALSVLGASHAGFTPGSDGGDKKYGLADQVETRLRLLLHLGRDTTDGGGRRRRVVLMAHSMGCWIAMEMLRILGARGGQEEAGGGEDEEAAQTPDVLGAVMLFPTVVDIVKSRNGRTFGSLLTSPLFRRSLVTLATPLRFLPTPAVRSLVRVVTWHPPGAAATTTQMLQHPHVLAQCLTLAGEEMETITADRWDADVWSVGDEDGGRRRRRRLLFYFGENDHWVANETREQIMKLRGGEGGGATMVVCEEGLPHGFCIDHGERMAQKVKFFIDDILEAR